MPASYGEKRFTTEHTEHTERRTEKRGGQSQYSLKLMPDVLFIIYLNFV
jgi:hypothetical protein